MAPGGGRHRDVHVPVERELGEQVNALPEELDSHLILAEARVALVHYALNEHAMPSPAWTHEDLCLKGTEVAEILLNEGRGRSGAISVYASSILPPEM